MKKNLMTAIVITTLVCFQTAASAGKSNISWSDLYYKKAAIAKGWKYIIIHHSATDSGSAASFHRYHTNQGYGGLCYHFVIGNGKGSPDGKIETGFRWEQQIAGTHVDVNSWYHNIFGIGICLVGNFDKTAPTQKQIIALNRLINTLCQKYNIPQENVIAHRQVPFSDMNWTNGKLHVSFKNKQTAQTNCPGKHFSLSSLSISNSTPSKKVPDSHRSNATVNSVTPLLKQKLKQAHLSFGAPIFIRIFKKEKILELWIKKTHQYQLFKTYRICTYGQKGLGPKIKQGDGKAPEGFYFVAPSSLNPNSNYHLSFNLGYPNQYDQAHKRTGSALMVHGGCVSIGCYAMTDDAIDEIWTIAQAAFKKGQPFFRVHIFPFKMTPHNMRRYRYSVWYPFWRNLKEGYNFFEKNGSLPPNVEVENKRYVFSRL